MKTSYKRKSANTKKGNKKSFFGDVRFLIVAFAFVFAVLGTAALNISAGTSGLNSAGIKGSNAASDYATVFTFKNQGFLALTPESEPVTDYLVTSNQNAVTGFLITDSSGTPNKDACVTVSIKPFVIKAVKAGEANIHLTAKMQDQSMQTISLKVTVANKTKTTESDNQSNPPPDTVPVYVLKCIFTCDYNSLKELDFVLTNQITKENIVDFSLSYLIIEGSVNVSLSRHTANLILANSDKACKIKFTALFGAEVVEFLFVNS